MEEESHRLIQHPCFVGSQRLRPAANSFPALPIASVPQTIAPAFELQQLSASFQLPRFRLLIKIISCSSTAFSRRSPLPSIPTAASTCASSRHNVERYSRTPCAGLVVLGSTGEAVMLSDDESRDVLRHAANAAAPEKVLLAGVARESLSETLRLAEYAAEPPLRRHPRPHPALLLALLRARQRRRRPRHLLPRPRRPLRRFPSSSTASPNSHTASFPSTSLPNWPSTPTSSPSKIPPAPSSVSPRWSPPHVPLRNAPCSSRPSSPPSPTA